ncbi:hypothetical protein [Nocardioides turkmenicus]|uniref:hypothetical protein n=1 Tax=Nocardioides turkmenicus TaxID=2711220 RepID=UPI0013ECACB6|nr:hypothetical protein [Nocardioides sp. KC13]
MKRLVLGAVGIYLAAGLAFSINTQPDQMWTCPDPSQPHGTMTYGSLSDVPNDDDCRPTVSTADRFRWTAFATPAWLPLVAAKGLSND